MKLTLLRHGETEGSRNGLYYGAANIPVLPESLEELKKRAAAGVYPTGKRYYTSGMLRAEQTLRAIYGDFEMRPYDGDLEHDPSFRAWAQDAEHNVCPHGESAPQVLARSLEAIAPVLASGEDAVCVIHGGVTSGLMMRWFGGTRYDYDPLPGTGYQVTVTGGKPVSYEKIPKE